MYIRLRAGTALLPFVPIFTRKPVYALIRNHIVHLLIKFFLYQYVHSSQRRRIVSTFCCCVSGSIHSTSYISRLEGSVEHAPMQFFLIATDGSVEHVALLGGTDPQHMLPCNIQICWDGSVEHLTLPVREGSVVHIAM